MRTSYRWMTMTVAVALAAFAATAPATADPATAGTASGFGARIDITDQNVLTQPEVSSTLAEDDASDTVIDIPASPLAVSGTLTASAAVHQDSDLTSQLLVVAQEVAGPYNARGFGEVEAARVLLDAAGEGADLLRADVIRAEAVATCSGDSVTYGANSEIVNLQIGGEPVPVNGPVSDLIDAINQVLTESGLNQVVNVQRNVVTQDANGVTVEALRVTVLEAAGDTPLGTVVLGQARVADVACGAPAASAPPIDPTLSHPRTGGGVGGVAVVLLGLAASATALRRRSG